MTSRSWREGDPEPPDHPPLVDDEGEAWLWDDTDEFDIPSYQRQKVTLYPAPAGGRGVGLGSPCGLTWAEILDEYGPLREAMDDEAERFTVTWAAKPLGGDHREGLPMSRARCVVAGWATLAAVLLIAGIIRLRTGKWPQ